MRVPRDLVKISSNRGVLDGAGFWVVLACLGLGAWYLLPGLTSSTPSSSAGADAARPSPSSATPVERDQWADASGDASPEPTPPKRTVVDPSRPLATASTSSPAVSAPTTQAVVPTWSTSREITKDNRTIIQPKTEYPASIPIKDEADVASTYPPMVEGATQSPGASSAPPEPGADLPEKYREMIRSGLPEKTIRLKKKLDDAAAAKSALATTPT